MVRQTNPSKGERLARKSNGANSGFEEALLPRLPSGQIRVRDAEKFVEREL